MNWYSIATTNSYLRTANLAYGDCSWHQMNWYSTATPNLHLAYGTYNWYAIVLQLQIHISELHTLHMGLADCIG
jgi:hypothetical protein